MRAAPRPGPRPLVMVALRGASMAAALALPCTLEASDFDDFRIPDHRARSMAMSLSTAATQSWGNSGAFEGESGSWGSGLTANGNWFRDSERIQTSTSFGLGGQGTRDRNENHLMLDIDPSFVRRSDGEASTRDLREFWSLGLGGRVYPWTVPLSMGGNVTNYASYDQRWMDQRSVDMLQRPTPPNSQRFEAQSDANLWRYSYATLIDADAGLGRVRDATGVYRAQLLVDRLGRDGVLARAPSREARARLARLYYIESDYSVAHDRGAKFFWRDVEKILGEDGALGPAGLDAYSLQHALEPYFDKTSGAGSVTPGNSSQLSDGASATLLMSRERADRLGIGYKLIFRGFSVAGCEPDEMDSRRNTTCPSTCAGSSTRSRTRAATCVASRASPPSIRNSR